MISAERLWSLRVCRLIGVTYRKPNPYGLHYIAKYYKVRVNDLLFTGDEEKDRITAERANCQFISIKDLVSLPK